MMVFLAKSGTSNLLRSFFRVISSKTTQVKQQIRFSRKLTRVTCSFSKLQGQKVEVQDLQRYVKSLTRKTNDLVIM